MIAGTREYFSKAIDIIIDDLKSDPYLRYLLLLSFFIMSFWIWYRVPNFATPDEYGRLLRPMKAAGNFVAEPTFASFKRGATDGVAQGATFYLYGLSMIPVFFYIVISGRMSAFVGFGSIESRWTLWHSVPEWFWTATILSARLVNIFLAVISVYILYRIATEVYQRRAGWIVSLLFSFSLVFVASAHEADEDTAMVFLLLLVVYLAIRYIRTGDTRHFLTSCGLGGLAIAFKLSAGVVIFVIGLSFFFHAWRSADPLRVIDHRKKTFMKGVIIGLLAIYIGMPNILFSGPSELYANVVLQLSQKSASPFSSPPPGYFLLYSYLNAVGLPMGIALIVGPGVVLIRLKNDFDDSDMELVLLIIVALSVYFVVFASWEYVKTHHVLPMIPLLLLLAANPLDSLYNRNLIGRGFVTFLMISTALYAGVGTLQYATEPRDQATDWIRSNRNPDDEMVVYENSVADIGIVHGNTVTHYDFIEKQGVHRGIKNTSDYTQWMITTPTRNPAYIQLTGDAVSYTDPLKTKYRQYPKRAEYVDTLLASNRFGYRITARFGSCLAGSSYTSRLLNAGIIPRIEKSEPCVIILSRK